MAYKSVGVCLGTVYTFMTCASKRRKNVDTPDQVNGQRLHSRHITNQPEPVVLNQLHLSSPNNARTHDAGAPHENTQKNSRRSWGDWDAGGWAPRLSRIRTSSTRMNSPDYTGSNHQGLVESPLDTAATLTFDDTGSLVSVPIERSSVAGSPTSIRPACRASILKPVEENYADGSGINQSGFVPPWNVAHHLPNRTTSQRRPLRVVNASPVPPSTMETQISAPVRKSLESVSSEHDDFTENEDEWIIQPLRAPPHQSNSSRTSLLTPTAPASSASSTIVASPRMAHARTQSAPALRSTRLADVEEIPHIDLEQRKRLVDALEERRRLELRLLEVEKALRLKSHEAAMQHGERMFGDGHRQTEANLTRSRPSTSSTAVNSTTFRLFPIDIPIPAPPSRSGTITTLQPIVSRSASAPSERPRQQHLRQMKRRPSAMSTTSSFTLKSSSGRSARRRHSAKKKPLSTISNQNTASQAIFKVHNWMFGEAKHQQRNRNPSISLPLRNSQIYVRIPMGHLHTSHDAYEAPYFNTVPISSTVHVHNNHKRKGNAISKKSIRVLTTESRPPPYEELSPTQLAVIWPNGQTRDGSTQLEGDPASSRSTVARSNLNVGIAM